MASGNQVGERIYSEMLSNGGSISKAIDTVLGEGVYVKLADEILAAQPRKASAPNLLAALKRAQYVIESFPSLSPAFVFQECKHIRATIVESA